MGRNHEKNERATKTVAPKESNSNPDWYLVLEAFARDRDYHDRVPQEAFLDRETGELLWFCVSNEDADEFGLTPVENESLRQQVYADAHRFIRIPGRSHGELHELLREYLEKRPDLPPYCASIGLWKKQLESEDDFLDYRAFCAERLRPKLVQYLLSYGVIVP
jgi:hypothetical protein